jgi:hypothetical protein
MVNINKHKMCIICNKTRPSFNYAGEKIPEYCKKCKINDMIDIVTKKCITCKSKHPIFNYEGGIRKYCGDCKLENMVHIKIKKCVSCLKKGPSFGYKHDSSASFCFDCKEDNMINISNLKCIKCDFNFVSKKYKPYCTTCYMFDNPNESITRNYKVKENTIMKFVKDRYPNCILYTIISGGCSKRRPDGLIEFELFSIIVEIDENCHRSYQDICENKRIMEIYIDLGFRPLTVIRLNPDNYVNIDNKKIKSIFSKDNKTQKLKASKKELTNRVEILLQSLEKNINLMNMSFEDKDTNIKSLNIEYLFFNENY